MMVRTRRRLSSRYSRLHNHRVHPGAVLDRHSLFSHGLLAGSRGRIHQTPSASIVSLHLRSSIASIPSFRAPAFSARSRTAVLESSSQGCPSRRVVLLRVFLSLYPWYSITSGNYRLTARLREETGDWNVGDVVLGKIRASRAID